MLTRDRKYDEQGTPVRDLRKAWQQLCVRAELGEYVCVACEKPWVGKKCECGNCSRKYRGLIPHDLRRSAAKALRAAGVAESVIMAAGGWKTSAIFRRYAIVSSADQRTAVELLERSRAKRMGTAETRLPGHNAGRSIWSH